MTLRRAPLGIALGLLGFVACKGNESSRERDGEAGQVEDLVLTRTDVDPYDLPKRPPLTIVAVESVEFETQGPETSLRTTLVAEKRRDTDAPLELEVTCEVAGEASKPRVLSAKAQLVARDLGPATPEDPMATLDSGALARLDATAFVDPPLVSPPLRCELQFRVVVEGQPMVVGRWAWSPGSAPVRGSFAIPLGSDQDSAARPDPLAKVSPQCRLEAAQLGARLLARSALTQPGPFDLLAPPVPVGLAEPLHHYQTTTLSIRETDFVLDGEQTFATLNEARAALEKTTEVASTIVHDGYRDRQQWVAIAAAPELPAVRVVGVIQALSSHDPRVAILFQAPDIPDYEPHEPELYADLQAQLQATPADRRNTKLAQVVAPKISSCEPAQLAFAASASADAPARSDVLARELPRGLAQCNCGPDLGEIEDILALSDQAEFRDVPVHVRTSVRGAWLEYGPDDTWAEVLANHDWAAASQELLPTAIWFVPTFEHLSLEQIEVLRPTCTAVRGDPACTTMCFNGDARACGRMLSSPRDREWELWVTERAELACRERKSADDCALAAEKFVRLGDAERAKQMRVLACESGLDRWCLAQDE